MATLLGPQDSASFSQAQWQQMFGALLFNGTVQGQLNSYVVTTTSGLGISVASGVAMIQGFMARSDAAVALTCATADPTNPRIDRAVLHADLSAHTLTVQLLTGTPAPSPSPPALTQTATVWEISVCQVRVNATQTTLTAGSLTDERSFAGLVNRGGDTMSGALSAPALGVAGGAQFLWLVGLLAAQYVTQQSGPANWHEFVTWNGSASKIPFGVGSAAAGTASAFIDDTGGYTGGRIVNMAGQGTAVGSLGAPLIVAQVQAVSVTATTQQTILSFTPSATGTYRANLDIYFQNSANQVITASVSWTDPDSSGTPTASFVTPNLVSGGGAPSAPRMLDGSGAAISHGLSLACLPITFRAKTGTAITFQFQDPGGVPADLVTAILERLA